MPKIERCPDCGHDWPERLDVFRRWIKATSRCETCVAELTRRRQTDETKPAAWIARKEKDYADYAERAAQRTPAEQKAFHESAWAMYP